MFDFLLNAVASGASTTSPSIDWSNVVSNNSFDGLISGITTILPIVVPVGILIAGIPVVIKLVKKIGTGRG